jgi:hypothetical protein
LQWQWGGDPSFATGQRQWGNSDTDSNCNCNGTGAGATGAGALGYWGNSDSDCNGNGDRIAIVFRSCCNNDGGVQSIAMGHWGNRSNRKQEEWGNGTVIIAIAINRSFAVCRVDVGHGRERFIPCVLIEKVSECQNGGANKGVMYLVDYFD